MKRCVVFLVLGAFLFAYNAKAWECEYGTVNAWVKLSDDTQWREAMVDGVTLKIHEPFKVKVRVTTKTECHVGIELYDPGVTKVFEVVDGPSKNGEDIDEINRANGWSKTYEWTVRPTGKWTGAYGPLNVFIQFTRPYIGDYEIIDKTIIHAYISSEEWKESENKESSHSSHGMPAFEFFAVMAAIAIVAWRRRKVG